MFNSSCWWINIVLTKNDIRTLINILIANPTQADLFPRFYAIKGFATFDVAQVKKQSYHDQHLVDQFLPLVVKVFGCLHKQVDLFLHNCANVIWNMKGPKNTPIIVLIIFFFNKKLQCER